MGHTQADGRECQGIAQLPADPWTATDVSMFIDVVSPVLLTPILPDIVSPVLLTPILPNVVSPVLLAAILPDVVSPVLFTSILPGDALPSSLSGFECFREFTRKRHAQHVAEVVLMVKLVLNAACACR